MEHINSFIAISEPDIETDISYPRVLTRGIDDKMWKLMPKNEYSLNSEVITFQKSPKEMICLQLNEDEQILFMGNKKHNKYRYRLNR